MGTGHRRGQQSFFKTNQKHSHCHGGILRCKRLGRKQRPLSTKDPLHVVFKIDRSRLVSRGLRSSLCFSMVTRIIRQYSKRFFVKVDQLSIQGDHIHILVRAPRRSKFHDFFRVVAGQIAQRFENEGLLKAKVVTDTPKGPQKGTSLWRYRPFSRVVRGFRAYKIVRDYIQLNEKEARGEISYKTNRLRGLSSGEWDILWR